MEPKQKDSPIFYAQGGLLDGRRFLIDSALSIGREDDNEIIIPDRQVSRNHAQLTPSTNGVVLLDLNSKNGTYVNGTRISGNVTLHDGDEVQIALAQTFIYLASDATMPLEGLPLPQLQGVLLKLDIKSRRVWVRGQELTPPLSMQQFNLLALLYEQQGDVVSRERIIETVWGDENPDGITEQAVDALVRRLRERLAGMDARHEYIITIRGHGLRLDNQQN